MKKFFLDTGIIIQKRILLFFLFALLTTLLFVRMVGVYSSDSKTTEFLVNHTYEIIRQVENIKASVEESEAASKSYLLSHDERWRQSMKDAQLKTVQSLNEAIVLINDTIQKKRLKDLEKAVHQKIIFQQTLVNQTYSGMSVIEWTQYDADNSKISAAIRLLLEEFMNRQQKLLQQRTAAVKFAKTRALRVAVAGMGIFFIFITGTLLRLNKDISRRKKAELSIRESESKYRRLIEEAGVTVFTCDLRGIFTYVSGHAQSLTGYSPDELTGKSFSILIPLEWMNKVAANYQQQISTRQRESLIEFPILSKTNQIRWVEQHAVLLLDEFREPVAYQCLVKDITGQKESAKQLKKSEEMTDVLLNNTREGFFMVDRNYQLLLANKQAREGMEMLSGKTVEVGMNFMDFVLPAEKQQAIENFNSAFKGEVVEYESKYDSPSGARWILISHSPIIDPDGNITGAAVVTHDITEKRKQEEKVRDSDQKMRAMLESTREGFFMIGHDYTIIMMNEVGRNYVAQLTGKNGRMGDNILDYIVPEKKEAFIETFGIVMAGGHRESETEMMSAEGPRWFHNSYFPVYNDHNEIIGICASSKDITEKKMVDVALAKIRAEREEYQFRLQSILDNTPLIIFIKDLEGRYLVVNKSFREMNRLTDSELIGKTDFDIDTKEQAERYKKVDGEVIKTLRSVELEETIRNEQGDRNLLVIKFPLFDKKNNIYGVGGIATDFTEKVQYRQKLIKAKKIAESAEMLQEEFLANMSHEIRTPMNGIVGMTNILMETGLSDEQKDYVNIIRQSSDNLLFLINDILDLSKIKSGKLSLENIKFNLPELLGSVIAPFRVKAGEKGLELNQAIGQYIPPVLKGDPYRLNQIINNLLSNALKFTEKGKVEFAVDLAEQTGEGALIKFTVRDSGIGIPGDKLNSIFNSFEQASSSTTRQFGGTGLGLAITKQLVEMQGGEISVSSEPGTGTEFSFSIRFQVLDAESPPVVTAAPAGKPDSKELAGKKILVAEDNAINQKVIYHILKKEGIITTLTENGREAVTLLEQGEYFDLIILDLQMPEMDGFQTTTYIRKKLKSNTPIIAMTASALRNEKMKCFQLGMNEYMTKPFSPAELFKQLKRFLLQDPAAGETGRPAASRNTEFYNLSHLHEIEDNQYFCEILRLFLETVPGSIDEIREAALYENWDQVAKKAHKMKSSLGVLQMDQMLKLVTAIELQAKEDKDTDLIPGELKELAELFGLIRPMIGKELETARLINAE